MIASLVGEGPTDRTLLPILRWLLARCGAEDMRIEWVDTTGRKPADKVAAALLLRPCDLLFIHRDADNQPPALRYREIEDACPERLHVAVVPIRTIEAWLLIDETALRKAAGRPSGREPLDLPRPARLEQIADPSSASTTRSGKPTVRLGVVRGASAPWLPCTAWPIWSRTGPHCSRSPHSRDWRRTRARPSAR